MYSLFSNFANTGSKETLIPELDPNTSINLKQIFTEMREALNKLPKSKVADGHNDLTSVIAKISPMIELGSEANLYGLFEKSTAAESLLFLHETLVGMGPKIQLLVPKQYKNDVTYFLENSQRAIEEVRQIIYSRAVSQIINVGSFLKSKSSRILLFCHVANKGKRTFELLLFPPIPL